MKMQSGLHQDPRTALHPALMLIEYIMNYEGKSKEEVIDMIPPAVDESTEPTPKRVKQSHRRSFELVGSNESN